MDWQGFMVFLFIVGVIISYAVAPYLKRSRTRTVPDLDERTDASPSFNSPPPRTVPAPSAPALVADAPRILGPGELAIKLDKAVHLLIVGETDSGKSTAANALLALRARTDRICVIDPHATPEDWGGLPAIGMGRDYPAIDAACAALREEMSARYDRRARGDTTYEPLTVFVDELPAIMQNCKEAKPFFGELLREARKVGMRLVCLTQSTRVKTLGIEGEGDVLENLAWLLLGEKALTACLAARDLERPAALDAKGRVVPAQTTAFPMLAARQVSADRLWKVSMVSEPVAPDPIKEEKVTDADLSRLLSYLDAPAETSAPAGTGDFSEREPAVRTSTEDTTATSEIPHQDAVQAVRIDLPQDTQSRAIRALVREGISRNQIIDLLSLGGGRGAALARIRQALGEKND